MTQRVTISRQGPESSLSKRSSGHFASFDLFHVLRLLFARRSLILWPTLAAFALSCVTVLLTSNKYTSSASILPSGSGDGQFADLKSLAGLTGSAISSEASSELFPAILRSQTVTESVIAQSYSTGESGEQKSLAAYFDLTDPDKLRQALLDITTISIDKRTGIIQIGVETKSPVFSRAILREYLTQLENYNRLERRSEARERAAYLATQVAEHHVELRAVEDSMAAYQESNRSWMTTGHPEVAKEIARFQRSVQTKAATYSYLVKEYEIAKLDVQKDTPITRVLDEPSLPSQKSGPRRAMIVLLTTVITGLLSTAVLLGVLVWKQLATSEYPESYRALLTDLEEELPMAGKWLAHRRERSAEAIEQVETETVGDRSH